MENVNETVTLIALNFKLFLAFLRYDNIAAIICELKYTDEFKTSFLKSVTKGKRKILFIAKLRREDV